MLRRFINWRLSVAERQMGTSVDYLRHILRISRRAFLAFAKIMPLANYHRVLPEAPLHVVRLTALCFEDCGGCVQGEVNMAKKAGVSLAVVQAVLSGEAIELPEELADVYHFSLAVLETRDDETLRDRVREHYGEEGLVEIALALGACRVFPTIRRALGYAKSCSVEPIKV
jgi:hypothetical protein